MILVGISLLLHGLLLIHWPTSKPLLEFNYQLQNLTLNLEPIEVIGQQQQLRQKALTPSKSQAASISRSVPEKLVPTPRSSSYERSTQKTSVANKTIQEQQQSVPKLVTPSMNRARILSQIRHDLSPYFYYPPLARRKGLQGTVLLGFGISGQGNIHDIRIVKSSGYAILDLAAQDAMQRLDKLSWYAVLMHGKNMDLELPVIFRLTEG
jgi:TonB family protein